MSLFPHSVGHQTKQVILSPSTVKTRENDRSINILQPSGKSHGTHLSFVSTTEIPRSQAHDCFRSSLKMEMVFCLHS